MRIISGKFKGRNLVSFKANHIRPTMDRVKETIFNKWMMYVEDATVLDLFSGTGNLGFEALSRGARHVTFVESSLKSLQIIQQNIQLLKIERSEVQLLQKDVGSFLKQSRGRSFDLIFVDPPFTEKIAHEAMTQLASSDVFHEETRIVIESIKQERMENSYGELFRYDQLDYGDKFLSFFVKK